jgi:hypothetical protein
MKFLTILLAFLSVLIFSGCEGDEFEAVHYQGKDCMPCHRSGENAFSSGLTVYKRINGANLDSEGVAREHIVQLVLENGKTIRYVAGNGYGNYKMSTDLGAIDNFTAQVLDKNGKLLNQSNNNSHNVGRMACNSCHTQTGLNGADGRVVNFDYAQSLASSL